MNLPRRIRTLFLRSAHSDFCGNQAPGVRTKTHPLSLVQKPGSHDAHSEVIRQEDRFDLLSGIQLHQGVTDVRMYVTKDGSSLPGMNQKGVGGDPGE
jgi:hypothetical protein